MADEKSNPNEPANESTGDYQAPAVEEVVSREGLERQVAYAGEIGPSQQQN
jgi:hypothetical protein